MAGQGKLGVFWGQDGLSFVEAMKGTPTHKAFLSFSSFRDAQGAVPVTQDARLLEEIQKTVRNNAFTSTDIYFSIPSKDIIVRWFVIPWMRPYEIQGVVAFEVRKYLPFPLEELVYTYYPSTITQSGMKQIGVVFVGIRKETFQYYARVLTQSGLNVIFCEPSSMSLLRVLVFRKALDPQQNTAILQINGDGGEIDIVSGGFVKFVRDFSLSSGGTAAFQDTEDFARAKLYNEVRISLDFFNRQHSEEVTRIIALTTADNRGLANGLMEDLGSAVVPVDVSQMVGGADQVGVGALSAFGITLSGDVPEVIDFNISEGEVEVAIRKKDQPVSKMPWHVWPAASVIVSAMIIVLLWLAGQQQMGVRNAEIASLKKSLGEFGTVSGDEIDNKSSKIKKFLSSAKDIPLRSSYAPVMAKLIRLMPQGMWIASFTMNDREVKASPKVKTEGAAGKAGDSSANNTPHLLLQFSGYLFMNNTNAEFNEVTQFVSSLRSDEDFSKIFQDIKLGNLKAQEFDGRSVTAFSVICQ